MSILLRVTQLNAVYLDQEILKAFQRLLNASINNLSPYCVSAYEKELNLILKLAVLHFSVVKNGSTFGQQLLSIRYEEITPMKRMLYLALNSLEYIKDKIEVWKPTHKVNDLIGRVHFLTRIFSTVNFILFLIKGTHPRLIEKILGLNQVYTDGSRLRTFGSKYYARELLWNSLIEIMVNVIPLINFHKVRRLISTKSSNEARTSLEMTQPSMTVNSLCPCCHKIPCLPHHMGCAHVFCYYCLRGRLDADSRFACPICGHWNENVLCERLTVR